MRALWLAVAVAFGAVGTATAQSTYQLEWWYNNAPVTGTSAASPLVVPLQATFELYLRETGGTSLVAPNGLSAFGVRATYGTPGVVSVASTAPPDISPDPAFAIDSGAESTASYAQFARGTLSDVPSTGGLVRLGSIRFTAGATPGPTSITAADIPGTDDWFRFDSAQPAGSQFVQFDTEVQSNQMFISPVPEPAAGGLLAVIGLLARRRAGSPGR